MNEPTIICPNCQHELKLTESIAAPLIQKSRQQFEQRLAQKDQEISKREAFVCPSSDKYGILASDIEEALAHQLFHFMLQGRGDASVVF